MTQPAPPPADASSLLRLEIETLWETDTADRLVRSPPPLALPAPMLVVAAGRDGCSWALSADVSDELADPIGRLLGHERAHHLGWSPVHAVEIIDVMASAGFEVVATRGPSFVVPERLPWPAGVAVRTSVDTEIESLRGRMPEDDRRTLRAPWALAVVGDNVAAVCETARSTPLAVEAGVWTYEPYRRRGLGAATTAVWSALVVGRTAFFSTSDDNTGSIGVARRLGLLPLGQWWILDRAPTTTLLPLTEQPATEG